MMSSITKTLELGSEVIIRRMSLVVAATICTSSPLRQRISSIKNRFDGSGTAMVSVPRTTNSGRTRLFSTYSRGRMSVTRGSNSR